MEIELEIEDHIVRKLQIKYQSKDLNDIINIIIREKIEQNPEKVVALFGKVDYFDDYDYKELRNRKLRH